MVFSSFYPIVGKTTINDNLEKRNRQFHWTFNVNCWLIMQIRVKKIMQIVRRMVYWPREKRITSKAQFFQKIFKFFEVVVRNNLFCIWWFRFDISHLIRRVVKWVCKPKCSNSFSFFWALFQFTPLRLNSKTFDIYFCYFPLGTDV